MDNIDESKITYLVCETIEKDELWKKIKKDKDFEKRVKEISSEVVIELFRILFQHQGIFKNLAK
jgi:hypothetical protein